MDTKVTKMDYVCFNDAVINGRNNRSFYKSLLKPLSSAAVCAAVDPHDLHPPTEKDDAGRPRGRRETSKKDSLHFMD